MRPLFPFMFILLAGSLHAEDLHPASDSPGFVPLFNGKDLAGWQTTGNWVIEPDGSISLHPREGEKGIDIVLNGYETRDDLKMKYATSVPYYYYRLQLVARPRERRVQLPHPPP